MGKHLQRGLTAPLFHSEPAYPCRIFAFKALKSILPTYHILWSLFWKEGSQVFFSTLFFTNSHFHFNNLLSPHLLGRGIFHQLVMISSLVYLPTYLCVMLLLYWSLSSRSAPTSRERLQGSLWKHEQCYKGHWDTSHLRSMNFPTEEWVTKKIKDNTGLSAFHDRCVFPPLWTLDENKYLVCEWIILLEGKMIVNFSVVSLSKKKLHILLFW